jgi:N-acetylneuraminate epimerase
MPHPFPRLIVILRSAAFLLFAGALLGAGPNPPMPDILHWRQLPSIPDHEGFATPFAGTSGGALIVAGGANFPGKRPWEGGTKVWYDSIFVLPDPHGAWKSGFHLPRPNAYGVSISTPDGLVCIGGGNANEHFRDVIRLTWDGQGIAVSPLPDLPKRCAFMCGARVDQTIYIIGGIDKPAATACLNTFWSLNLSDGKPHWRVLDPCPGPARLLGVAGSANGSLYLFSGARLFAGPEGQPVREFLRDAWRYTPGKGWTRLADMPRAAVAAASPAPLVGAGLLVLSGDDGLHVGFKPETEHPGFPHGVLSYDTAANTWTEIGQAPFSRGTVPLTQWGELFVIPNGEARPGYRSAEVWGFHP